MLRYSQKQDHQKVTKRFLHSQLIFEHFYQMYCLPAVNVLLSFLILVLLFFFSYKTFMVRLKCTFQTPLSPNAFSALLLFFFFAGNIFDFVSTWIGFNKSCFVFYIDFIPYACYCNIFAQIYTKILDRKLQWAEKTSWRWVVGMDETFWGRILMPQFEVSADINVVEPPVGGTFGVSC